MNEGNESTTGLKVDAILQTRDFAVEVEYGDNWNRWRQNLTPQDGISSIYGRHKLPHSHSAYASASRPAGQRVLPPLTFPNMDLLVLDA